MMPRARNAVMVRVESKSLIQKFRDLGQSAHAELKLALQESGRIVRDRARTHHRYKKRSGALERATRYRFRSTRDGGYVNVFIDEGIAPYGRWVHNGVPPHLIKARRARNLKFYWERMGKKFLGPVVFHPGIGHRVGGYKSTDKMPDDFVERAYRMSRKEINQVFRMHMNQAIIRSEMRNG